MLKFADKYMHRSQQLEKEKNVGAVKTSTEQCRIPHKETTALFEHSPQEVG